MRSEISSGKTELRSHDDVTFWVSNSGILIKIKFSSFLSQFNFKEIASIWKEKIKIVCKEKKGRWESNPMMLLYSNESNRMILIHSNISKFFKKQHTNTLCCFANRRSLEECSKSMDEKFFLKKIEVTRFIGRLFTWTTIEGQSEF